MDTTDYLTLLRLSSLNHTKMIWIDDPGKKTNGEKTFLKIIFSVCSKFAAIMQYMLFQSSKWNPIPKRLSKPPKDQWEKIKLMNYNFQCMLQRCCKCAAYVILGLHVHNKPQTPLTYRPTQTPFKEKNYILNYAVGLLQKCCNCTAVCSCTHRITSWSLLTTDGDYSGVSNSFRCVYWTSRVDHFIFPGFAVKLLTNTKIAFVQNSVSIYAEGGKQGRIHGHQLRMGGHWAGAEMRVFPLFDSMVTDQRMDGRTDRRTDARTKPLIELRVRN